MNESPQSTGGHWKKTWAGSRGVFLWSALVGIATFFLVFIYGSSFGRNGLSWVSISLAIAVFVAVSATLMVWFIRWLRHWRNFKRFLFAAACLVTLIALAYAGVNWRSKHNLEKYKHEWEAKGEKFDFGEIIPPPVPDDQNFALTPILFSTYGNLLTREGKFIPSEKRDSNFVDRLDMPLTCNYSAEPTNGGSWQKATLTDLKPWQEYYRNLATVTNLFPIAPRPQSPAEDVLLALSKYDSTIEELRQAARLPYSRFPLNYNMAPAYAILLPHLANLKRAVRVLQLRAIAELQNGQSDQALADVTLSLRLADAIRTEPFIISHLVRIAILAITLQPVYEGLAAHQWSEAQLAELDSTLGKLDFLADYEASMRGERACQLEGLEYMRRTHHLEFRGTTERFRPLNFLIPSAFFYQNELTIARLYQLSTLPMVDVTNRTVSPAFVQGLENSAFRELSHISPYNFFARMDYFAIAKAVKKYAHAQSSVDLARVAIALERYKIARGEYPESLDALAPQFLKNIPHDVIGGRPLKYRRVGQGEFTLYSIGWNQKDDGGTVILGKGVTPPVDLDRGDWVWTYPAK
ncbi:MAG TPA: hypothetical protein VG938_16970 [Verrucomicrobiae bacterium]|jgi:hypothetical protein|nr:hypothetical protein [Verrucomicrobiae bacterium]